ncbi:MAG TPA: O-antigen ligase family protein [Clostridiaceae bacterium]|nr:O-antigen ligase family protein [Clostridiaceae bacterium]
MAINSFSGKKTLSRMSSFYVKIICFIFLYALFALDRIKKILSFRIGDYKITNEIWIIPFLCLLMFINTQLKFRKSVNSYNLFLVKGIFLYLLIIIIGGFNLISIPQYIYAALLFIIPMFLFFPISKINTYEFEWFIKLVIIVCFVYAIFSIVLTTNYAFFMKLIGNPIDYRYSHQFRAPLMLGSSITVSYYYNLTLPICFYMFYSSKNKKWRIISILTIIFNLTATFLLLSRAASLTAIIIVVFYLMFAKSNKNNFSKKIILLILILLAILFILSNYNVSRLLKGFGSSGNDMSISARITAGKLGLYIFSQYPLFGSGMGRFYERAYIDKYIIVDGFSGLIDPHNMYIIILSELGIAGLAVTIYIFSKLFIRFSKISDLILRKTAYITLFCLLFDAIGGSHLVNEISFSTIFWIYMGLFNSVSINDLDTNEKILGKDKNKESILI